MTGPHRPADPEPRDLGFGSVVSRESRHRLLNPDGSFNVRREGLGRLQSLSGYHYLLTVSWPRFLLLVGAGYLATNGVFALGYLACGPGSLSGPGMDHGAGFLPAFFFSVHTLATIGYGVVVPANVAANLVVTFESLVGLLGFALVAGLAFARVSRPTARIIFSRRALIAPFRGGWAFMFRIVNARSSQLVELHARVLFVRRQDAGRDSDREFHELRLERRRVAFFPLAWTVVHPIDPDSPLNGMTAEQLAAVDGEFLILLTGIDETSSQTVHARSSYQANEVLFGARFSDMFERSGDRLRVDVRRVHQYEPVGPAD